MSATLLTEESVTLHE